MLTRMVDFLKTQQITAIFTSLTAGGGTLEANEADVSSLMDTWLLLYNRESNGEHNRQLYVLKSRGMPHSNQIREFVLSNDGIRLREAYIGPEGVLDPTRWGDVLEVVRRELLTPVGLRTLARGRRVWRTRERSCAA